MKTIRKTILPALLALALVFGFASSTYAEVGSAGQIVTQGTVRYYNKDGGLVTSNPILGNNAVVSVNKTIAGTDVENEFVMTLEAKTSVDIKLMPYSYDAAVVMVLDVSNSMGGVNPDGVDYMPDLISACKTFINSYADANGAARYVSLVTFAYDGKVRVGWVDVSTPAGYNTIINSINGLIVEGSTAMECGLQLARNLLRVEALPVGRDGLPIRNRNVIVFSDGDANMNPSDLTNSSVAFAQGTTIYGSGTQFNDPNNNPAPARCEAMAEIIRRSTLFVTSSTVHNKHTANIHTVAFGRLAPTTWLGEKIATNPTFAHQAGNLASLNEAFAEIILRIESWAEAWVTTDPMGPNIEFITSIPQADIDSGLLSFSGNELSWDLKKADYVSFVNNIYTYRYEYRIKLDTSHRTFTPGTFYPTNGTTELTYVILEDGLIVSDIMIAGYNVPRVKGYGATLNFTKVGPDGTRLAGCAFILINFAPSADSYPAVSSGTGAVSVELASGQTYTLKEVSIPATYTGKYKLSQEEYTVTVSGGEISIVDSHGAPVPNGFNFVNPYEGKTVKGLVSPMVVNNPDPDDPDLADFLKWYDITVELRPDYWTPAVGRLKTTAVWSGAASVGEFTIDGVLPGNYLLYIKRPGFIVRCLPVTISLTDPDIIQLQPPDSNVFNLYWGDANGDGIVDGTDVSLILLMINVDAYSPRFGAYADLNGDGFIDGIDVGMAIQSLNRTIWDYPGAEDVEI